MSEVVVVTGAGAGAGRAIARRFADDGATVALLSRGATSLGAVAKEVSERGGTPLVIPTDVADAGAVEDAAAQVEDQAGPIDIWVNNTMTTVFAFFEDVTPEEYTRATEVTYLGSVWGTQAALRRMLERDRGTIVQVGSALAYRGIPLQSAYCGAKHALKGFVESVRTELRHRNSRVHLTMVQMPGMNTPQFEHCRSKMPRHAMPVAPIFEPELAAEAVHWAAHNRRRETYVGISSVYTILGNKLAPALAERYLASTAVSGQLTDDPPTDDNREGNLYEPVDEDRGARGVFSDQAHSRSVQFWATRHRLELVLLGLLIVAAAIALPLAL